MHGNRTRQDALYAEVGAVHAPAIARLARSVDDPALSDELLAETRAWIGERSPPDQHRPAHGSRAA